MCLCFLCIWSMVWWIYSSSPKEHRFYSAPALIYIFTAPTAQRLCWLQMISYPASLLPNLLHIKPKQRYSLMSICFTYGICCKYPSTNWSVKNTVGTDRDNKDYGKCRQLSPHSKTSVCHSNNRHGSQEKEMKVMGWTGVPWTITEHKQLDSWL